jgi:hypothetical protein
MKHSAWLQDRTPACALNGKTPYGMGHKKKPHLAGIQEFGAAAYVKDLSAEKLDAQAKKGCFVVYNSEFKDYRIYWPEKRSITVKQNVVFNQEDSTISEDVTVIHTEAQSEGKKENIIQAPQDNTEDVKKPEDKDSADQQTHQAVMEPHQSLKFSNSVPFPSANNSQHENNPETLDESQPTDQQYGCGQRVKHQKGHYKTLNEGCVAAITAIVDETQDDNVPEPPNDDDEPLDESYELLPDIALASHAYLDPKTLDEALMRSSNFHLRKWPNSHCSTINSDFQNEPSRYIQSMAG